MFPLPEQGYRPLIGLSSTELVETATSAGLDKNLEQAKLCVEEASYRWTRTLKKVLSAVEPSELPPAGWLDTAREIARRVQRSSIGEHNLYVILLHKPKAKAPFGLYVGETAHKPAKRFGQHRKGVQYLAAGAPKKHGVCLLPFLYEHLNPLDRMEAKKLEAALATKLEAAGYWVEGGH